MAHLDGTDDTFDSREVIARIEELKEEIEELYRDGNSPDSDYLIDLNMEVAELILFAEEEGEQFPDFPYGETFIHENFFETYAEELAYDIGAIDREASWPLNRIDWEAAANDLKMDYTAVEFRGETYYARA